ncbi:hypothetical protein DL96DRAFT_1610156 [Flagelloscypha sp. PMI_526]|nr:hypothetical protein DL96DRAFT_1610156 [Flagelloscypha sp. PMI_526]
MPSPTLAIEIWTIILSYCSHSSIVDCCLVSHQFLSISRAFLYHRIRVTNDNIGGVVVGLRNPANRRCVRHVILVLGFLDSAQNLDFSEMVDILCSSDLQRLHIVGLSTTEPHAVSTQEKLLQLMYHHSVERVYAPLMDFPDEPRVFLACKALNDLSVVATRDSRLSAVDLCPVQDGEVSPALHSLRFWEDCRLLPNLRQAVDLKSLRRLALWQRRSDSSGEETLGDEIFDLFNEISSSLEELSINMTDDLQGTLEMLTTSPLFRGLAVLSIFWVGESSISQALSDLDKFIRLAPFIQHLRLHFGIFDECSVQTCLEDLHQSKKLDGFKKLSTMQVYLPDCLDVSLLDGLDEFFLPIQASLHFSGHLLWPHFQAEDREAW